jgi:hypothetical protein
MARDCGTAGFMCRVSAAAVPVLHSWRNGVQMAGTVCTSANCGPFRPTRLRHRNARRAVRADEFVSARAFLIAGLLRQRLDF